MRPSLLSQLSLFSLFLPGVLWKGRHKQNHTTTFDMMALEYFEHFSIFLPVVRTDNDTLS